MSSQDRLAARVQPDVKRKVPALLPRAAAVRELSPTSSKGGHVLRAVLVAAVASGLGGCDPTTPRTWPDDAARGARRLGEWLHVIEPMRTAGEMPAVHPMPVPAPSASPSSSSSSS